jgi:hypothetical protein
MMGYQFVRQLEILPKGVDNATTQYATDSLRNNVTGCTSPARIAPLCKIIIVGLYIWSPESGNPMLFRLIDSPTILFLIIG